ncbi:MAG TPA: hypothetical protein VJ010_02970, partial [Actinomycetota bacterium]|nr:hypothetical protein [Actinomycetota bacterium]
MSRARWSAVVVVALLCSGCSPTGARRAAVPAKPAPPVVSPTATPAGSPSATAATQAPTATATPAATVGAPVAAAAGTCPAAPPRAAPRADRPRYTLTAGIQPAEHLASGTLSVVFTPDLPTDHLVFRLWPNGPVLTQEGAHLAPGPVTVDGSPATPSLPDPTTMIVPLPRPLAAGQSVTASMPWRLTLPGNVRDRIGDDGPAVRMGTFYPLLSWEPGVGWATDPPTTVYAEATTSPAADFDLTVSAPDGWTVLATGVNDRPGHFSAVGVPDVGLSAGQFSLATGTADGGTGTPVAITVGVAQGLGDSPQPYVAKVRDVIASYARRFGAYPWPSFSLALTSGPGTSGIEYPMHVMQGPGTIGRTTPHEIGHQWFYGLVGNDQGRDPWLDEGLASWAEARHESTLAGFVGRAVPPAGRGHLGEPMTYWTPRQPLYYAGVYVQGVQALAALGPPDRVDCALRVYAARNAYQIARPADLVDAAT